MKLSTRSRYGTRAVVVLALNYGPVLSRAPEDATLTGPVLSASDEIIADIE